MGLRPYVAREIGNRDGSSPRDPEGPGVTPLLPRAEEPRGHSDGCVHPLPLGWSRKARWEEEPSLGRDGCVPQGWAAHGTLRGWRVSAGGTRCGTAAFESLHLLTRAVTTERVIGTCCSVAVPRVPPARLGWRGRRRPAGCCPNNGLICFALSSSAQYRNRLRRHESWVGAAERGSPSPPAPKAPVG